MGNVKLINIKFQKSIAININYINTSYVTEESFKVVFRLNGSNQKLCVKLQSILVNIPPIFKQGWQSSQGIISNINFLLIKTRD